jgi:ATP-binding cassette subfamily F protein 3
MLSVHSLSKSFDLNPLFENVNFSLQSGDRLGLIGPNGCGKTTLMRILAGLEEPSSGHIRRAARLRLGYLPQGLEFNPQDTVAQIIGRAAGDPQALEEELAQTAMALAANPNNAELSAHYDNLLSRVEAADTGQASQILAGLGLQNIQPGLPAARLSGGEKTRLGLALVLLGEPQLLLLDEPTNHLDVHMLEWLEDWLRRSPAGALFISHDRAFLDNCATAILEMNPEKAALRFYAGNFSAYMEQRQAEVERQWINYQDQQDAIQTMRSDIERAKRQAAHTERETRSARIGGHEMKQKGLKDYLRSRATKVAKKAKARETKLDHYLEDGDRVERPREARTIRLEFGTSPHLGKTVLQTIDLAVGYQPGSPLVSCLNLSVQNGQKIVLTGDNGSGKTTLFRTLLGELAPLAGRVEPGATARLGYMPQEQSGLEMDKTALETIQPHFPNQTAARTFLARFQIMADEALKPCAQMSYGQRARLLLALMTARECNFLLLDEPLNHLDIASRAQFEEALGQFEGAVLAIVHDRYFIERFASEVWWLEDGAISVLNVDALAAE